MNQERNISAIYPMLRLMRPTHWIKNGFVLAPLIFTGLFTEVSSVVSAVTAMALFCLASSFVYIINDYRDIESDRNHPVKVKTRPFASGEISKAQGLTLLLAIAIGLLCGFIIQPNVMNVLVIYILINISYSFYLKNVPIVDMFTIAIGFVLRVYAGAMALDVSVSSWMFATTLCLALYLAAMKRKQELVLSGNQGRKVLEHYTVSLVDRYAQMSATAALLFYALFIMTSRPELTITIPLVIFGFFRYWYVAEVKQEGESPTDALLHDFQLLLTALAWVCASAWALWPAGV